MIALVQRHGVELKKSGRSYKGRCPFHQEKSPSFYVWPEEKRFKCFGCHAGGDAISFVQRLLGKTFVDTVQRPRQGARHRPRGRRRPGDPRATAGQGRHRLRRPTLHRPGCGTSPKASTPASTCAAAASTEDADARLRAGLGPPGLDRAGRQPCASRGSWPSGRRRAWWHHDSEAKATTTCSAGGS